MPQQHTDAAAAAGASAQKNGAGTTPGTSPVASRTADDFTPKSQAKQGLGFDRSRLPDPVSYYESVGLVLQGRGKWRTAPCSFHGGSDSLRINVETGAFVCMAGCGARGGDVLAYHRALTGKSFVEAAKDLGAWVGGDAPAHARPAPFPARDALELLAREATLVAIAALNMGRGESLSEHDKQRLLQAAARVSTVAEVVL